MNTTKMWNVWHNARLQFSNFYYVPDGGVVILPIVYSYPRR